MKRRTHQQVSPSLAARALSALDPEARAMALRDARFGGEIDIGGAWLARHDGLSSNRFCSRQRNARRLMSCGPDRIGKLRVDPGDAGLDLAHHLDDPLAILAGLEAVEAVVMASGGLEASMSKPNALDVRAAEHAMACGIGLRRAQMVIRDQREVDPRQIDLFDLFDGEDVPC